MRLVADRIAPALGQPIVIETRTGADGGIAAELVARSPADGYPWLATSVPFATQITLQPKTIRYHPLKDFQPVANLGTSSFVLVVPNEVPATTLKEFVDYAKARPGKLSYGGTSAGSVTHLSTEMFKRAAGIEMEMIPYAGIPPAIADLLTAHPVHVARSGRGAAADQGRQSARWPCSTPSVIHCFPAGHRSSRLAIPG